MTCASSFESVGGRSVRRKVACSISGSFNAACCLFLLLHHAVCFIALDWAS
jgi:hypothetical protein